MRLRERKGFSLMEVYVALCILSIGTAALGRMLDIFVRMETAERLQSKAFVDAVHRMEFFVGNPPVCDSVVLLNPHVKLTWIDVVEIPPAPAQTVHFRRLVPCR